MQTWILLVIVQISRPPGGLNMSISAILGRGPSTAKIEPPSTTYHVDLTRQQIPSLTPLGQRILQVMASCGSKISDPSRCTKAACFSMMFSDSLRCVGTLSRCCEHFYHRMTRWLKRSCIVRVWRGWVLGLAAAPTVGVEGLGHEPVA